MRLRLIRHATLIVDYAGEKILVDPMLDDVGVRAAIENSPNPRKNPLVPVPVPAEEVMQGITAVLVSHTHSDHWDGTAAKLLPKDVPLFGQREDEAKFRSQGFKHVHAINDGHRFKAIEFTRTECQHGTGEIGAKMAPASGFVLEAQGEPTFYIAGDTVWCRQVAEVIRDFQPKMTVVNAGAAQFLQGDPITMTADCVVSVCRSAVNARIVAVHMEAINHCLLTRSDLAFQLDSARVREQVIIPADGDWVQPATGA